MFDLALTLIRFNSNDISIDTIQAEFITKWEVKFVVFSFFFSLSLSAFNRIIRKWIYSLYSRQNEHLHEQDRRNRSNFVRCFSFHVSDRSVKWTSEWTKFKQIGKTVVDFFVFDFYHRPILSFEFIGMNSLRKSFFRELFSDGLAQSNVVLVISSEIFFLLIKDFCRVKVESSFVNIFDLCIEVVRHEIMTAISAHSILGSCSTKIKITFATFCFVPYQLKSLKSKIFFYELWDGKKNDEIWFDVNEKQNRCAAPPNEIWSLCWHRRIFRVYWNFISI